ncbi:hypothetical protein EW145_g1797 [Phellinidium pouzarii]|uniref:Xylanolytic transcriptional activator regulatory domain-containing protein n=1 Tax=Phellinidium pouzarii TaxID=167371 RepID=A0A4S4LEV9_9AGAM|nr:hypothetical protein EW145_g1797 [Phellinidium pouzarii]
MAPTRGHDDDVVGPTARNKKRSTALSCAECRRFVLANTESLHEKIAELSHRVRSLEDALAVAHDGNERHPLLSDELLKIKNPLEREVVFEAPKSTEEEDVIDAVGSLSISHTGRTNFYGQTANSWNEEGDHSDDEEEIIIALPTDSDAEDLRSTLIAALPDAPTARALVDLYFSNAAWMYYPIPKDQFDKLIFSRVYPYSSAGSPGNDAETDRDTGSYESHRLALLYIVLAVGILVDLNRPSHDSSAVGYFQLSKAALGLDSIMEEPSVPAIQALTDNESHQVVMCHYMFLNDVDSERWTLMGIVIKLAQSIGLHRDSTRWNLSPEETKKRRELFWEIYVYDSWQVHTVLCRLPFIAFNADISPNYQSLTYGRPPSLAMAHIDCKMAHETTKSDNGKVEMSFAAWKHRFASECLSIVHDQVFGARTPSYATVMELDKRVRSYYIPPSLQTPGFGGAYFSPGGNNEPSSLQLTMQRYVILAIKEVTVLYMHRGFFAKAMSDFPSDPLSGRYGHSVLRAHESASFFIILVRSLWLQHRQLTERNWFLFTHVFSCAIVLGSIPTKCPGLALARSALQGLDQAYELFSQIGETARAAKVLPVLGKLRDRAHASMNEYQSQSGDAVIPKRESPLDIFQTRQEDELATLGGKTRLVSPKASSGSSRGSRSPLSSPTIFNSPPPQTPISPTSPASPSHPQIYTESLHMQRSYPTPVEDSPVYQSSPEMALFGSLPLSPEHMHAQGQPHAQAFVQWQPDPALAMGYMPLMAPPQNHGNHAVMQIGPGQGMEDVLGVDSQGVGGQYGMNGYFDMEMRNTYMSPQSYGPMGPEAMNPQDVDLNGAWRNLLAQYGTT